MEDHHQHDHKSQSPTSNGAGPTRSARSSTLPSQRANHGKHRYIHRHHNSTSHKTSHQHRFSTDLTGSSSPSHHNSPLYPLGELLSPVKRNVTEGLSGVAGWIDRDRDKERSRATSRIELNDVQEAVQEQVPITPAQVETAKQKRKTVERLNEEQYNSIAAQAYEQHASLAESRSNMLRLFGRLDSTLLALSTLRTDTETLLENLTQESIPELTDESMKQLQTYRATISNMETSRITKLQARIDAARTKTADLGNRLGEVRNQVKVWEDRDAEEDRKRRRRVGVVWSILGVFTILVVLLLIWGRVNEQLEAMEETKQNWMETVIEKEKSHALSNDSEVAVAQLLRSLHEEISRKATYVSNLPGDNISSETEDGLLSEMFDEL